ncbi:thiol reductant ABC exporter subunit CydD [Rhizobium sp. RAF56]|uniref:thiol reductant ABC exporter subunit CydD n=1 Tax=Rhizobium sp. RAF56 TaxID=3233062 RepID=UPI003F988030
MTAVFFEDQQPGNVRAAASAAAVEHGAGNRRRSFGAPLLRAGLVQSAASLIWVPQAALISRAVGEMSAGGGMKAVLPLALLVLALGAVRAGLDALGARMAFRHARAELSKSRERAVLALSRYSPIDRSRPASGFAASLIAEQAETIVPYLARFQPVRLKVGIVPPVLLLCILPVSWIAGLTLLLTAPLIPLFMALIGWRAKAASEKHLRESGNLNAFLLDRLRGLATIRALDAVETTAIRLKAEAASLRQRIMAVLKVAFLSSAVLELFSALGVAAIAVYVGFSLLGAITVGSWGTPLSLVEGLFILLLAPAFFEPLRELSAVWHDRAAGQAALEALEELSASPSAMVGGDEFLNHASAERGPAAIRIDRLRFRHAPGERAIVDDFNLAISPGEHVALLGASGSGKTTLLSLIAGLAPHEAGAIMVGGRRLDAGTAFDLRGRMAWVGQQPHIFAGTIKGNIKLGRPDVSDRAVAEAISRLHLDKVADSTSAVGEAGLGLSGGEALRLALARIAADEKADIILADEPTAHLDADTAAAITDALLSLAEGRTLVVATHDPLLAARMHRIIRLGEADREDAA